MSDEDTPEPEEKKPRGYWSDITLRKQLVKQHIIQADHYSDDRIEPAAYRLRVGAEVYITPVPGEKDPRMRAKRQLKHRESVVIPSGQFAILCTEEKIRVPRTTTAFIGLRMKQKLRGLINVSGFHAEPGYEGHLLFAVFNAGPSEVHVARGDEWFMISFLDLDIAAQIPRAPDPGRAGIPTEFTSALASEFPTIKSLDAKIGAIEREQAIVRWATAIIVTAVIAFGVRQCSSDSGRQTAALISQPTEVGQ